jgi:mRNA interferase HigB
MRLIGREVLETFVARRADARGPLDQWAWLVMENEWRNFAELLRTLPTADQVKLDRVLVVTVFNIGGNNYRLISKVAYRLQVLLVLKILTHADYDRGRWRGESIR